MGHKKLTLKYHLEYAALRACTALFNLLPYRAALAVGWLAARLAFHVVRFRRAEAEARIREVFGDRYGPRAVRRIAWVSLRNFLFNGVELLRMAKVDRAWIEARVDHREATETLRSRLEPGRGAILAIPHTGNWELAGVGMQWLGFPMFFVTGRQHNPLTDGFFNRLRGVTGIETIPRGDVRLPLKVLRNLKRGKILGFMPDLRARRRGIEVRFLGKKVNAYGGMGAFARQAGVAVTPAYAVRVGWTRHRWQVLDPVVADPGAEKEADGRRVTQDVLDAFDRVIRDHPEQYFWYNKRWILLPFEGPARSSEGDGIRRSRPAHGRHVRS